MCHQSWGECSRPTALSTSNGMPDGCTKPEDSHSSDHKTRLKGDPLGRALTHRINSANRGQWQDTIARVPDPGGPVQNLVPRVPLYLYRFCILGPCTILSTNSPNVLSEENQAVTTLFDWAFEVPLDHRVE